MARSEYGSAVAWYEVQQSGLGLEFESAVQAVLDTIAGQPDQFPISVRDIREAPVRRFPYCVCYRVRDGKVVVVAVFHQARDPAAWHDRQ
ncbi:MAG: type II toxin-antitoxin system RelE/ParE family toxin [Fimbriiglobus sp.]